MKEYLVRFIACLAILCCPAIAWSAFTITTTPLLETCGITTDYSNSAADVTLEYKLSSSSTWKDAYPLIWDPNGGHFAGSIVNLEEETTYNVRVRYFVGGSMVDEEEATFTTWTKTENLPIKTTYQITDLYDPTTDTNLVVSSGGNATDGWVKIVGDGTTVIDAGYVEDYALQIANWKGYIILENLIIRGGRLHGIRGFQNHHIRIVNCDISGWGRQPEAQPRSNGRWYENNTNNLINYDSAIYLKQSGVILVERCYVHDPRPTSNAWSDGAGSNHPNGPNAFYAWGNHPTASVRGQIVVRYNDFIGSDAKRWNDAIEGDYNGSAAGGFHSNSDIYGNFLAYGNDDGTEIDGGQTNVKFFRNRVEGTYAGMSVAPTMRGPSYVFQNLFVNLGDIHGNKNTAIKAGYGSPNPPLSPFLAFNNTSHNASLGIGGSGGVTGKYQARTRNNLFYTWTTYSGGKYGITDNYKDPLSDYDYDMIINTAYANNQGQLNVASGQEPNGILDKLPTFESIPDGDFNLATGSEGIDAGEIIPNFSDGYVGTAPDMGALEHGSNAMLPHRPINQRSDVSEVEVIYKPNSYATTANVTITNPDAAITYTILKNDAFDWLTVTPASGTLPASGSLQFSVTVDHTIAAQRTPASYNSSAPDDILRGAFIVKLNDGFSIPIAVYGEKSDDPQPPGSTPDDIILDNESLTGVSFIGAWTDSSWTSGYYGTNYSHDGDTNKGNKSATFTPQILETGSYEVSVWWTSDTNRASNVPIDVVHANGTDAVQVDQTANGGAWVTIGTYTFNVGSSGYVEIGTTGTNGYVIVDAVKFAYVPTEIIMDNTDMTGVAFTGSWTSSTYTAGYYGSDYSHDGDTAKGSKSVTYTPQIPITGTYQVSARWTSDSSRASNAPIDITHAYGVDYLVVDQQVDGGVWVPLSTQGTQGTYQFNAGTSGNIMISNTGTNGYVIADGIRLTYVGPPEIIMDSSDSSGITLTGSWNSSTYHSGYIGTNYYHDGNTAKGSKSVTYTPTLPNAGNYEVFARWTAANDRSNNVPFEVVSTAGTQTVYKDQTIDDATWVLIGVFNFDAGSTGSVTIKNDGTSGFVIADGVKFVPAP
ncbi:BACON domain-containing protein [Rubellicoccus peritrichatus]|uniref:Uncharacterized protein n=1 Tax=Rubellicoccus peritrichatus TaxID=3080537 RepID=A0AAQ3QYC2_9BACT|nr:hypothetical protein [Puniceicoccus sp. CR14]WOO43665.1 hypothetical protein RZN69_11245 [Puniceicoccus sp. CR14]